MTGLYLSLFGAALAIALAGTGSALGVAIAGEAAAGVLTEDPEKFGKLLPMVAIPGTQGFYGFLTGFWVMLKIGLLTGNIPPISPEVGLQILAACLPVGIVGLTSGISQGQVAATGIFMTGKRIDQAGRGLTLAALVETYAILGLLATILLLNGIKVG